MDRRSRTRTDIHPAPPSPRRGSGHAATAADILDDHLLRERLGKTDRQDTPAVSDELPAAKGTTMVTGRVGQLCADTAPTAPLIASAATAASAMCLRLNMVRSSDVVLCCDNKRKKHASVVAQLVPRPI